MTYMRKLLQDMHRDHLDAVARKKRAEAVSATLSSDNTLFVSAWADYDRDDVITLWEATCLSVGFNPKHEAVWSKDFAEKLVAMGSAADDCIKKLNEVLRRYKNVSTHAKNPNSSLNTADELRTKIELSAFRKWVETEKQWELPKGFPGAPASTATPSPTPESQAHFDQLPKVYAEQLADRRAANCYDIHEAAQAIALQLGLNKYRTEKLLDDMGQAAFDGALTVRSPGGHDQYAPTSPPKTTYGFDSLITPDDVNKWAADRGFAWRWLSELPANPPAVAASAPGGVETDQADSQPAPVKAVAEETPTSEAGSNWKMRIQTEAASRFKRLRASGASPTVHSILDDMAAWCRTSNVKTDGGIYPSAGYLRTHVLGGNHWTPPR